MSTNTSNTIVIRDNSGNFSAGTITANLVGNVTGNLSGIIGNNYKVGCYAGSNRTIISKSEIVRFNTVRFDPNNNYNSSTWTYTSPVTGLYMVLVRFLLWLPYQLGIRELFK